MTMLMEAIATGLGVDLRLALSDAGLRPEIRAIPLRAFDSVSVTLFGKAREGAHFCPHGGNNPRNRAEKVEGRA
jgi:hypothetical protein